MLDKRATVGRGGAIHPQYLTHLIDQYAADDAVFTADGGSPMVWALRHVRATGRRRTIVSLTHGTMANAMPQALGAKKAAPNRQVISLRGDGGLSMLLGDLITAIQEKIPVKIAVFNNSSLGFVELEMKVEGLLDAYTNLENPDFARVAQAMGFHAQRVEQAEDLEAAVRDWIAATGQIFHEAHGLDRFPIKIASIATEYSRNVFPDAPITKVEGIELSAKFEGMLLPHPNRNGEWGIIYNNSITSKGRINFTLGHELGHYLLHRHLSPEGFRCSSRDMLDWKSEHGQIEAQANTFASFLLMPLDDFREQIRSQAITMALMRHLSDRYEVSITAAILKWLGITDKRAMIVVSKDGFIDWAWGSKRLFKSGIYYRARQETVPLPELSLAARRDPSIDAEIGFVHPKGVWVGNE
jgi:Thiamine pyrophosphate enzyme, C-terminal TPP binding domain/IrrE N-terminal-like domain